MDLFSHVGLRTVKSDNKKKNQTKRNQTKNQTKKNQTKRKTNEEMDQGNRVWE